MSRWVVRTAPWGEVEELPQAAMHTMQACSKTPSPCRCLTIKLIKLDHETKQERGADGYLHSGVSDCAVGV